MPFIYYKNIPLIKRDSSPPPSIKKKILKKGKRKKQRHHHPNHQLCTKILTHKTEMTTKCNGSLVILCYETLLTPAVNSFVNCHITAPLPLHCLFSNRRCSVQCSGTTPSMRLKILGAVLSSKLSNYRNLVKCH